MSFNLEKYLTENNLTIISKIREDVNTDEVEPSKEDLKKSEKDFRSLDKKKAEYNKLKAELKPILARFTVKKPDGTLSIKDVQGYKKAVGNIPDRLKLLKSQIDKIENPKLDQDEEDSI